MAEKGSGDIVRQVPHHDIGGLSVALTQDLAGRHRQDILADKPEVLVVAETRHEMPAKLFIDLDSDHATRFFQQLFRQNTKPRTNFHNGGIRAEFSGCDDLAQDILINEEMLAKALFRRVGKA